MKLCRGILYSCLIPALLAGCTGAEPTGDLSGAVTLNGSPLKGGEVSALNDKDEVVGRSLVIDGRYDMTMLPLGATKLVVVTHTGDGQPVTNIKPVGPDGAPPPNIKIKDEENNGLPATLDPVPLKYTSAKTSGFQVTLVKGPNTLDLAMTGKGEMPPKPIIRPSGQPPIGIPGGPPGGFPPGVPPPPGGFPPGVPPPPPPR